MVSPRFVRRFSIYSATLPENQPFGSAAHQTPRSAMAFNGKTPSNYVELLTQYGIRTNVGNIPITSYVSTGCRSPRAHAAFRYFESLLRGGSASESSSGRDLAQLRQRVMDRGGQHRASQWRRAFSGQGTVDNIADVMNFIADHQDMLRSAAPFAPYFTGPPSTQQARNALRRMVADEIFGLDCLGFTGTYLVWSGTRQQYPECQQRQYFSILDFDPISNSVDIGERCIVVWLNELNPAHRVEHIAFIDSVIGREGSHVVVNLCQSSRGGPQTNREVRLTAGSQRFTIRGREAITFRISGGNPAIPVGGHVIAGKRRAW